MCRLHVRRQTYSHGCVARAYIVRQDWHDMHVILGGLGVTDHSPSLPWNTAQVALTGTYDTWQGKKITSLVVLGFFDILAQIFENEI